LKTKPLGEKVPGEHTWSVSFWGCRGQMDLTDGEKGRRDYEFISSEANLRIPLTIREPRMRLTGMCERGLREPPPEDAEDLFFESPSVSLGLFDQGLVQVRNVTKIQADPAFQGFRLMRSVTVRFSVPP
jgi:hypothetical protein